ncbi:MAG: ABC transporter substrate-binding protein [Lachnospiraceae bacterium]|nr:ABC transporter substrate-binding protein [Lachnospiraceae bacterium]
MKKKIVSVLLACTMVLGLTACGSAKKNDNGGAKEEKTTTVRWNAGTSGNVLITIAEDKGYFKDEGINVELVPADANSDALTMLSTGKVDIVSNAGTSNPLQQIASGVDLTIFGGHMVTGAMPVIAKAGTKWNGIKDLVGKKFACNPSYFAFTGALMDAGVKDPLKAVNFVSYTDYNDALAAVKRGEVDYALMGTGQNYAVKNMKDVDIMCYQSDIMPNYSCCRMECQTKYLKDNSETLQKVMVALLRAQDYYEGHKDEAVKLHAKAINADESYVAAYMLDDKHYKVSVDPLKNSVERAWNILSKTGFLDKNASKINIDDHINTELYSKALSEAKEKYGKDSAKFYEGMETFFNENDK